MLKKLIIGVIIIVLILVVGILVWPEKQPPKVYHFGTLMSTDAYQSVYDGFLQGMPELGYIEGQNSFYELYNIKGDKTKLPEFTKKLVDDYKAGKLDVIIAISTTAADPLKKATAGTNIPIIFIYAGNPRMLITDTLVHPGGNLTGISSGSMELIAKRLEILLELKPTIKKVIIPLDEKGANYQDYLERSQEAVKLLGVEPVWLRMKEETKESIQKLVESITKDMGDAVLLSPEAIFHDAIKDFAAQAKKEGLPLITVLEKGAKEGALATYSPNYLQMGKQGAVLVDKIIRGALPAETPIEMPEKIELIINLTTAKEIGVTISPEIMAGATLIED